MHDRAKTGASAGAGAAIGLALATVVLPQLASALNPTGWGTFAVALWLALLGAAVPLRTARNGRPSVWFAPCLAAAGLTLLATVIVYDQAPHVMRKPRSISDQINTELNRLIDDDRNHVVVNERLQLHPSDEPSWIVVTEHSPDAAQFATDTEAGRPATDPRPTSDEVRIYDIEDGWLTLKLDYRPVGRGTGARRWVTPAGAPAAFDYNGNGFPEIIAGYSLRDAWDALLPFVVNWTGDRYKLSSMTPDPPALPVSGLDPVLVKERHIWYQTRTSLRDAVTGAVSSPPLNGYQVGAFAFVASPSVRLLTGYLSAFPNRQTTQLYELRSNQISLSDFHLGACHHSDPYCDAPSAEQDVHVPPAKLPDNALLMAWQQKKALWAPIVSVTPANRQDCPGCD
jgi:hypothetical protein